MMYNYAGGKKYLTPEERKQKEQRLKHEQTCAKNRKKRKSRKS